MKRRYRWDSNLAKLVEITDSAPVRQGHYVIPDETEPFTSMADGKTYTSKSAYRKELRARGFEEIGNEKKHLQSATPKYERPMKEYVETVKAAARDIGMDVL